VLQNDRNPMFEGKNAVVKVCLPERIRTNPISRVAATFVFRLMRAF
jgi:hypothetical protein